MSNALIKDYSYLKKDLASLKLEIWGEMIRCCLLRKKFLELDEDSYFKTIGFLDEEFADISQYYFETLEKTKDFHIILYLNKTWKTERLLRRMKKILKKTRKLCRQLERLLNLDDQVDIF